MHIYRSDRVVYSPDANNLVTFLAPDFDHFSGSIVQGDVYSGRYLGYDDWVSHFARDDEQALVSESIQHVQTSPTKRIHIRGISTAESVELIRAYYRACGYEDALAKNYILPVDVSLTVSVSLAHVLWCEKNKTFLNSCAPGGEAYGHLSLPVRSPHDLRALQQALRMGIIMGVELLPDHTPYINQILERQIISPFALSQMLYFRWIHYGFSGTTSDILLQYPDFSGDTSDD